MISVPWQWGQCRTCIIMLSLGWLGGCSASHTPQENSRPTPLKHPPSRRSRVWWPLGRRRILPPKGPCGCSLRAYPNNLRSATLDHSRYDWGMKIITCKTKRTRTRSPNNKTTTGYRISDDLWAVLQPLLPVHLNPHPLGGGRPRIPDRQCANAIFYVLRTGCQWQALDETELCAHSTAHDRYQEWVQAGVFLQRWKAGVSRFDELQGLDGDWLSMDGAITKAPLGGDETGPNPTDRGKSGVKRSLLTEGQGVPVGLAVPGAHRHDMKMVRHTIASVV